MSLEQAAYIVFERKKNSSWGNPVNKGKPVMATSAEAACNKLAAKDKTLRRGRLFAKPKAQLELEKEAREKAKTQVEVELPAAEEMQDG